LNGVVASLERVPAVVYWLGDNLYLNITNQCSNHCYFCIRNFARGLGGFNLKLRKEPTIKEVIKELEGVINLRHWREVVFCGFGEPLERLDCVLEVTRWIKKHFGTTIRIDTNGQGSLLNKGREVVKELKEAGVDKISISLNAHDKATYNLVCKPELENAYKGVLTFIKEAKTEFDTEITAVVIPEVDIREVEEIARKLGVRFRRREYWRPFW